MSLGTFDKLEEDDTIRDDYRIHYMAEHIKAMYHAVPLDGVDLMGYTVKGDGMVYVDCDDYGNGTYRRICKKSFNWYKNVIVTNGAEL